MRSVALEAKLRAIAAAQGGAVAALAEELRRLERRSFPMLPSAAAAPEVPREARAGALSAVPGPTLFRGAARKAQQ